jgi:EmrB/QacA subfamily drug resistance transporter
MTTNSGSNQAAATAAPPPPASAAAPPGADAASARPNWGTLIVVLTGTFMSVLDFFIVNVAIPSLQRDLHASAAAIQFVVAGYALAFSSSLITGGRLGDIFGRRRMFVLGVALFTLASLACGLAPNTAFLEVARIVQGASAALMSPQVLSILGTTYTGEARARAFGAFGVTMGIGAVLGQLIGGTLIQLDVFGWSWRTCFLINLPIGLVALLLVPRYVRESKAPGRPRLDLGGMVLATLAVTAVVLPLIEGRQQGWPLWAWLCLAAAVPLFAVFAMYERRVAATGGSPLVNPELFQERAFTAGLFTQLIFYAAQASFYLLFAIYVQFGRGLDPLQAGLIFVGIGGGYLVTSTTAQRFAKRWGRQVIAVGSLMRVVGLTLLLVTVSAIGTTGSILWIIPALVIDGAGMGLAVAPLTSTILSRMTPQHAGSASGVLTAGIWSGNALGVAVSGVIFYNTVTHGGPGAYPHAFMLSLVYFAAVSLVVAALVQLLPRSPGGR